LHASPAAAPFSGYREVQMRFGARCARVAVADTEARRQRGLRDAGDRLGPYAGMLFVQPADSEVAFTMSGMTVPLDLTWFAADGSRIGRRRMRACRRAIAACPLYRAPRPYRFALETPAGAAPGVSVSPCV
jgi:uncharacterized membrane protein (UPF0127 family)